MGRRQLTEDKLYCDREPAYLPNGDVVFSSDRGCGASQWGAAPLAYSDFGLPNLSRVSADGQRVERLTYNKDVDRYPHCLNNGQIGYMRWDYQERFWQWPHALWTIRPDGTMNDGLFKVHFNDPQSVREPRSIPGSQKLVVIACGHHSPPEGAVAVVDPSLGVNNPQGLRYVTPLCSPLEGGLGSSPKELIHRDPTLDVLCPMPVRQRPKPPSLPAPVAPESNGCEPDGNPADAQPHRVQAGRGPQLCGLPRDQAACAEDRLTQRPTGVGPGTLDASSARTAAGSCSRC